MMKAGEFVAGRPLKYKTADELQTAIDQYFEDCKGKPLTDEDGEIMLDKHGFPVIVGQHPPTITGLALALGFTTRKSLLDYQGKKEFVNTITRAKTRVEEYAEGRLFDKDGANGAKFSLQYNFKWATEEPQVKQEERHNALIEAIKDMK
jgi:hypothetical protein